MKMDDANPNIHKPSPTKPSPANTRIMIYLLHLRKRRAGRETAKKRREREAEWSQA